LTAVKLRTLIRLTDHLISLSESPIIRRATDQLSKYFLVLLTSTAWLSLSVCLASVIS
jgi:hypothetical protein